MRAHEPVDGRYGAPLGRPARSSFIDRKGRTQHLTVNEHAPPFTLVRVRLDSGGYDRGGAYWGLGEPLYEYTGPVTDISGFVRGSTRDAAKAAVRRIHPAAQFYR